MQELQQVSPWIYYWFGAASGFGLSLAFMIVLAAYLHVKKPKKPECPKCLGLSKVYQLTGEPAELTWVDCPVCTKTQPTKDPNGGLN